MSTSALRILVTGARGLIGQEALGALSSGGYEVLSVVRDVPGVQAPDALRLDLRRQGCVDVLVRHRPDWIVHAAAVLPSSFTGSRAEAVARDNRAIDDVVLEAAKALGCRLVYLSSTSLYGCVSYVCSEDSPVVPPGPYGHEKLRSEEKVLSLRTPGIVLRVSAPYGVSQRLETVLWKFIRQASAGNDLTYYGSGAREQDFTAVEDVGTAILASVRRDAAGVFNVASGQPISMKALAELVIGSFGSLESRVVAADVEDPQEHCRARISITKARRDLGWEPRVPLSAGIRKLRAVVETDTSGTDHP